MKNESNTARENEINNQAISNPEEYKESVIKSLDKNFVDNATRIFREASGEKFKDTFEKVPYRKVDNDEAARLKEKIGRDLSGYEHNITNTDIRHMFTEHGNKEVEEFKGQRAITERDILLIPEITKNYDDARLSPEKSRVTQQDVIIYKKKIGDEYIYLETIGGKKSKELRSKTMWIIKGKGK